MKGEPPNLSVLGRMQSVINHRGPDDSGVWADRGMALAHCRLSVIDPTPAASQPMTTPDGKVVLVYNGEVYNFRELSRELEAAGVRFRSAGDTEVVLWALRIWGPERSIPRFNGMFALAYADVEAETLWLARDRLGIKPLVVAATGEGLIFASEPKALFRHPQFSARVSSERILRWLAEPRLQPHTVLYEGVENVKAGSWLRVSRGGVESRTYFSIPEAVDVERLVAQQREPRADASRRFDALFGASIRAHLISDAPLAVMCSGGVDSSLIAAVAAKEVPNVTGYVGDVSPGGEGAQAERVGTHIGVPIRRVPVDRATLLKTWPMASWNSDGPLFHASSIGLFAVATQCRRDGMKVLLTGEGADELFGGYPWHAWTYKRWAALDGMRRWLMRLSRRTEIRTSLARMPFLSPWDSGGDSRMAMVFGLETAALPWRLIEYLKRLEPPSVRAFVAHCLFDVCVQLPCLLHRHDRMGMAASIEMRVPFLENGLIDFALHASMSARYRDGTGKWVVRKSAMRYLPHDIVHAQKKGFPVPGSYWQHSERLLRNGLLAERLAWSRAAQIRVEMELRRSDWMRFYLVGLEIWLRIVAGADPNELGERLLHLVTNEEPSRPMPIDRSFRFKSVRVESNP